MQTTCDKLRKKDRRLKTVPCCKHCHSSDVMYQTPSGRVCCKVAEIVSKDFDFIHSVDMSNYKP